MKQVLYLVAVLLGAAFVIHSLVYLIPGDPAQMIAGEYASQADIARIRGELNLDLGFFPRYALYISKLARFDLGVSISNGQSVAGLILERFPATLLLAGTAMLLAACAGIFFGVIAAVSRGSILDRTILSVSSLFISTPVFVTCILLSFVLSYLLGLLPPSGKQGLDPRFIIMPAMALASRSVALVIRVTRNEMIAVLGTQFITAARAFGFPERTVVWRFAFRNILVPVAAVIVLDLGAYLGGAVVTEMVFSWPGVGRLLMVAIQKRDIPLMQGVIIFNTILFVLAGVFLDFFQSRLSAGRGEK